MIAEPPPRPTEHLPLQTRVESPMLRADLSVAPLFRVAESAGRKRREPRRDTIATMVRSGLHGRSGPVVLRWASSFVRCGSVLTIPSIPDHGDLGLCCCEQPLFTMPYRSQMTKETATSARAQNDHITDFALGLIAGRLLGAGLALAFAPPDGLRASKAGRQLRQRSWRCGCGMVSAESAICEGG